MKKNRIKVDEDNVPGFKIRGKIGNKVYQGTNATYANASRPGDEFLQIRAYVIPNDPMTPEQLIQRMKLITANSEWQEFTDSEKRDWNERALSAYYIHRHRGRLRYSTGYHYYLGQRMRQLQKEIDQKSKI